MQREILRARLASVVLLWALTHGCAERLAAASDGGTRGDAGGDAGLALDAGASTGDAAEPVEPPEETACIPGMQRDATGFCAAWTALEGTPACFGVAMLALRTNAVLVLGNCHDPRAAAPALLSGFAYQPADGTWELLPDAPTHNEGITLTELPDYSVLVLGGVHVVAGSIPSPAALVFSPSTREFSEIAPLAIGRHGHTATLLTDGRVLVTGGSTEAGVTASVEIYDLRTRTWSIAPPMRVARSGHAATLLSGGAVVITGGVGRAGVVGAVEIYEPWHDAWVDGPAIRSLTGNDTASPLPDDSLLVVGGSTVLRSYASLTGFLPAASMHTPREGHLAITLGDMLFVVGGVSRRGEVPATAELYDYASNSWSETAAPPRPIWRRGAQTAALTTDGVLIHSDNVGFFVYQWLIDLRW